MKTKPSPHPERGQSLVEFAISLTAILILLAGAVDFGIGLFHYIAMREAAQEGALYGSMNPPASAGTCPSVDADLCNRVANAAGEDGIIRALYDAGELGVAVSYTGAHCEGNGITVALSYDYPISMPFIGAFVGDTIRLRAAITDTILTPVCP
jgi:hypothetical protein